MAKYENPIAQAARFRDNMPFDGMAALQQFLQAAATPVNDVPPYGNAREPQPGIGFGPPEAPNMRANINRSGPIGALQSLINSLTAQSPEALGPNAPPNTVATRISNASMRAPVGNGIVSNAGVSGTYTPPDPTNLDIYGPGIALPGGNVLGGITAEERTPRRPETLPIYSSAAPAARQSTAPLPAREDRARGEPYVAASQASAPKAGDIAGSPISVVRALQNTNYLPVMDAQGRVSYQSEEFIREQAARAAAAEKARADLLKTKAGTAKDLALSVPGQVQQYFFNIRKGLEGTLASLPENDTRRTSVTKELERLDAILAPKTPFLDAATAAAYGKLTD